MKPSHTFSSSIDFEIAKSFKQMANNLKRKPAHLIREFIEAAVENRVKIIPENENQKVHKNLYGQ